MPISPKTIPNAARASPGFMDRIGSRSTIGWVALATACRSWLRITQESMDLIASPAN